MSHAFTDRDRESVERDLQDPDEEVRRLAVERVGALPDEIGFPQLVNCLGDSSWRVRKAAVERLVARKESVHVANLLVAALADGENPGRRNAAVEALVHCGERVVDLLIEAAASPDEDVRKLVVDALAGIGVPRSRVKLLAMLSDPDPNVRAATVDALAMLGGSGVADALMRAATSVDEEQLVRFSAIRGLNALEVPVRASELESVFDDSVLGPPALALLGRAEDDDRAVDVLLKALSSRSRTSREAAMRSLVAIVSGAGPEAEPSMIEMIRSTVAGQAEVVANAIEHLADADLSTGIALVQFLGLVAAEDAVVPVLFSARDEALAPVALSMLESLGAASERIIDANWSDFDAASRRDGCVLFGRTEGERSAARLLAALDDPASEVRTAAALSIGKRMLPSGLAPLVRRLVETAADADFESEEELSAVVEGLSELAGPGRTGAGSPVSLQAVELLTASLEGASEHVRLAVATVIGRIGTQQNSEAVAFLLRDPSSAVRRAAVDALAQMEGAGDSEPLRLALADESSLVRIAAARALGASNSATLVDDLERLALDEDSSVRAAAVRSIVLRFILSDDEPRRAVALRVVDAALLDEAPVALSAIEALTEVGGPETSRAKALLTRPEPELVREAIRCISIHREADALEELISLIAHPDWSVRAEAIQTVADRGMVRAVPAILGRLDSEQDEYVREITLEALRRLESGVA